VCIAPRIALILSIYYYQFTDGLRRVFDYISE
jgi:hypothetical protein